MLRFLKNIYSSLSRHFSFQKSSCNAFLCSKAFCLQQLVFLAHSSISQMCLKMVTLMWLALVANHISHKIESINHWSLATRVSFNRLITNAFVITAAPIVMSWQLNLWKCIVCYKFINPINTHRKNSHKNISNNFCILFLFVFKMFYFFFIWTSLF